MLLAKYYWSLYLLYLSLILLIFLPFSGCLRAPQARPYRIGILTREGFDAVVAGFKDGLEEWGNREGISLEFDYRNAGVSQEKLVQYADQLVSNNLDVIFTVTRTPTQIVKTASSTKKLPIIFWGASDPVEENLVASLNKPGDNVSGVWAKYLAGKNMEYLFRAVPSIKKVFVLYSEEPGVTKYLADVRESAGLLGLEIIEARVENAEKCRQQIEQLKPGQADAILQIPSSAVVPNLDFLIQRAYITHIPLAVSLLSDVPKDGALLSYSYDLNQSGRQAAAIAESVLKGKDIGGIPVQTNIRYSLQVNLKTAREVGIAIPADMLNLAEKLKSE